MDDEIDLSKYSKKELEIAALLGIRQIIQDGILAEWLVEVAQSMAAMENRLRKLEAKDGS